MKKALVAALTFMLVGFMLVNGTLAGVFNQTRDIFADLTASLGEVFGAPTTDGKFDVDLVNVGKVEQLYPGGQATHQVQVVNCGELGACFRLAFAVQKTTTWDKLSFTFTKDAGFVASEWMPIKIGNDDYNMMVFTYTDKLAPDATQYPTASITIAMDKNITSKQIEEYRSDFLQTQVLAIEADLFMQPSDNNTTTYTAEQALDMALPLNNFNPFN